MHSRWDRLFADLEAQFSAPGADEAEVAELVEAERVGLRLTDRLVWRVGGLVDLRVRGGGAIRGALRTATQTWIAVDDGATLLVVPSAAIALVGPLGAAAPPPQAPAAGRGMGSMMRALARAGARVTAAAGGHQVSGTVVSVGADHFDLRTEDGAVLSVSHATLDWVRCRPAVVEA